jgi:hypothetical protein
MELVEMGKCRNHPDRETSYLCSKYTIYMCEECFKCSDPEIYCKFRSSCPIWFVDRRKAGLDEDEQPEEVVKNKKIA